MQIHTIKSMSTVRVVGSAKVPPEALPVNDGDIVKYLFTDGMYAKCKNADGEFVYVAAWTEVDK